MRAKQVTPPIEVPVPGSIATGYRVIDGNGEIFEIVQDGGSYYIDRKGAKCCGRARPFVIGETVSHNHYKFIIVE